MPNYNASITYWKINAGNTQIATSNSGEGSPTEQIAAPKTTTIGSTATVTGANVTGSGTTFVSSGFVAGMYLYYVDNLGLYVLAGQILSVGGQTSLTLTATAISTFANRPVVASYNLISIDQSFYIRIPTETIGSGYVAMPDLRTWRTEITATASNNPAQIALQAYSDGGNPLSIASPAEQVPFTLQFMNILTTTLIFGGYKRYINTTSNIVKYVWLKATPNAMPGLSSSTMYRLTAEESIPCFFVSISGLPNETGITEPSLNSYGYFFQ